MKPKKSLGQNFLTSIPARIAIVNAGTLTPSDTVLEIGPGKGFLTQGLLDSGAQVIALEKDRELVPFLTEKFSSYKNFSVTEGDALTNEPPHAPYKLIANIPYYITGAILETYLSHAYQPTQMVVLVQAEVAERVVARNGKESILSIAVKVFGDPKLVYRVKRGSFNPIPNVDSAVLSISNISRKNFTSTHHEEIFFKVLKAGFAHKRKFMIRNLESVIPVKTGIQVENLNNTDEKLDSRLHGNDNSLLRKIFSEIGLSEKVRAEDVTLSSWIQLSLNIATHS